MTIDTATAFAIVLTGMTLLAAYWLLAYIWMRRQLGQLRALLALALGIGVMHTTTGYFFIPYHWSLLEACLAMGVLLLLEELTPARLRWAIALTAIATLNRETALLLAVWIAGRTLQAGEHRYYGAFALIAWAIVYGAIRLSIDASPRIDEWTLTETFRGNLTPVMFSHVAVYLGPAWGLAVWGMITDKNRRWLAAGVVMLLALFLVFGSWGETRILYPVLPALLMWVVHPARDNAG